LLLDVLVWCVVVCTASSQDFTKHLQSITGEGDGEARLPVTLHFLRTTPVVEDLTTFADIEDFDRQHRCVPITGAWNSHARALS
jgi:hypothetical protein